MRAFVNEDIFTGNSVLSDKSVLVKDGKVVDLIDEDQLPASAEVVDLGGASLVPGFVDMQANGGGGILLNDDSSVEALRVVLDAHSKFGTTHLFPTVFTPTVERMHELLHSALELRRNGDERVAGLHFEGPIINPDKAGVHNRKNIREAEEEIVQIYLEAASKMPTLVTLAPEMVEKSVIERLARAGVLVFAGHTQATYDEMTLASASGLLGVTHLYNACSGPSSREPGAVGHAMVNDAGYFSIIVDGHHVHFASVDAAIRCKEPGKAFLVTDAMPALGSDDPTFSIDDLEVFVRDGRCQTAEGVLAGSALDMATAVRNCIQKVGINRAEAIRMATLYPAEFAGLGEGKGCIQPGSPASFVVCDNEMNISSVYVAGEKVA